MAERRSAVIIELVSSWSSVWLLAWAVFIPRRRTRVGSSPLTEVTDSSSIQDRVQLSHLSIATAKTCGPQNQGHRGAPQNVST